MFIEYLLSIYRKTKLLLIESARSRDPNGFELLIGLVKNMVRSEKLLANPRQADGEQDEEDAEVNLNGDEEEVNQEIMDALRTKSQGVELANSVTLVEKLAY